MFTTFCNRYRYRHGRAESTYFSLFLLFPFGPPFFRLVLAHELIHEPSEGVDPHRDGQRGALARTHCFHHVQEVAYEVFVLEGRASRLDHTVRRY